MLNSKNKYNLLIDLQLQEKGERERERARNKVIFGISIEIINWIMKDQVHQCGSVKGKEKKERKKVKDGTRISKKEQNKIR